MAVSKELLEQVHAAIKELRDSWEEHKGKTDTLYEEKECRLNAEIDQLKAKISTEQKRADEFEKKLTRPGFNTGGEEGKDNVVDLERVIAYSKFLKKGFPNLTPEESKALSSVTDPEGGYVVTEEIRNQLIKKLRDATFFRSRATVLSTSAASIGFPTFGYNGDADWVANEGQQIGEDNITNMFGKTQFTPYTLARIFRVPDALAEDAAFDIENFLTNHFSTRFGEIEENVFLNGDGVNKPLGLLRATGMNTVATGGTALSSIDADDFVNSVYAVKKQYRAKGAFLSHRQVLQTARKLKDTTNQYIWQIGLQAGQPDTILGYPVEESEYFPVPVASGAAWLFGDLSYYWIVDRLDLSLQRLTEKYAEFNQIGYKLRKRVDGAPVMGESFALAEFKA
ncbi:MAG: phage major capsid protein [Thermincolia bacterium]